MNPFAHTKYIKSISLIVILLIIGISGETTTEQSRLSATDTQSAPIPVITLTEIR